MDGIWGIRDDGVEWFVIPVLGVGQGVPVCDVELLVVDVVQEHIDAAEIVCRQVDFLPEEPLPDILLAQHLGELQQERPGAASRVVDLVHLLLADNGDSRQQFRDLLRREELPAGLAGGAGVHRHQELVCIAEGVVDRAGDLPQAEIADGVQNPHQLFIALGDGCAQFVAVHVEVAEQPLEIILAGRALRRILDILEDRVKGHIQILVVPGTGADIAEEFGGQDEEPLVLDGLLAPELRLLIVQGGVVESSIPRLPLPLVDELRKILGDEAVEEHPQDIALEVPSIDTPTQVIGNLPDGPMKLCTFLFLSRHCRFFCYFVDDSPGGVKFSDDDGCEACAEAPLPLRLKT